MIRLIKPYICYDEVKADFEEIFNSGIFTKGTFSMKLPEEICRYTGAKYSFNTTSATTALAVCLEILNVSKGDEVIISDFSFPATVNVVEACGATPIFCDVDRESYNMLPEELYKNITNKTKAVIFVSALGNPSGLDKIQEICTANNITLIHDAACAIGSKIGDQYVGGIADLECFSFHPRKLLTSGEGGAITTSCDELADRLKIKLSHGATVNDGKLDFVDYGYNYRLPDLQCVMLLKQIAKLDEIVMQRVRTQQQYIAHLEKVGFCSQKHDSNVMHNMQSVVFTVPEGMSRDVLINYLANYGIESTIGTYCLSNCTYYKKKYNNTQINALWLEQNTITLPCYCDIDVDEVVKRIMKFAT